MDGCVAASAAHARSAALMRWNIAAAPHNQGLVPPWRVPSMIMVRRRVRCASNNVLRPVGATRHNPDRYAAPDLRPCIYECIFMGAILLGCAQERGEPRGTRFRLRIRHARLRRPDTAERVDDRTDYGEPRIIAIGLADGLHLTVVYTDRPGARDTVRRIISTRRSNRRERKAYDEAYDQEA